MEEQPRLRMDVDNDTFFVAFNPVVWLITQTKVKTRTFSYYRYFRKGEN